MSAFGDNGVDKSGIYLASEKRSRKLLFLTRSIRTVLTLLDTVNHSNGAILTPKNKLYLFNRVSSAFPLFLVPEPKNRKFARSFPPVIPRFAEYVGVFL